MQVLAPSRNLFRALGARLKTLQTVDYTLRLYQVISDAGIGIIVAVLVAVLLFELPNA